MQRYCQQWVHKTQDEDKTKKNNKENQKDEDHGQLSAHEGLSVPASYQAFEPLYTNKHKQQKKGMKIVADIKHSK